jgi:predicted transcriptional regulator
MNFIRGYYSIVQYCPDPSRLEAVNLGVALFCPQISYLDVRFVRRESKVDQLFGRQDWEFIERQLAAIQSRLAREKDSFSRVEDFAAYTLRRANAIRLTSPRPVKVERPEVELGNLLKLLVADPIINGRGDGGHRTSD